MRFAKEVGESLTYQFAQAANEMKAQGREIISLGLGEPDFPTPAYVADAMARAVRDGYTHYSATQGLPELRACIAGDINAACGSGYGPMDVIVTPGIKAAVYFALCAVLEPGDEAILISPYYVSYPAMVKLAEPEAKIVDVPLSGQYDLDVKALRAAVSPRTRCILLNSPNNPTGMVLSKEVMDAAAALAAERGIYVISDEVYGSLTHHGRAHRSFAAYPELRDRLVVANGYSKSHAMTGWRLGYAVGAREIIARMNKLQQHINTNTCTFIQKAACSIYENEPVHLPPYIRELERRMAFFHENAAASGYMTGVLPEAGFFYFADISAARMDSNTFCVRLLKETGIASTPGIAFGPKWDSHVRFSVAVPMEVLERAAGLLRAFGDKL